ncbi:MAG: hypothetical protein KJ799_10360 [Bacteroidetes bacterium]|nr:hypothetical protein [Bacteroidota bacterium]MBU1678088.1 hypothetical protein [Bacteroidota bacterium]MBU2507110.1 hypothetical protein [Bacteroidota bacterium]
MQAIEALIPIISVLVTGFVFVTWIYFKSKEKQMMIERGMSYGEMMEFLKSKKSPYTLLKIGIVVFFFGLGLGIGLLIEVATEVDEWIPFLLFTLTGIGFALAALVTKRLEDADKKNGNTEV